MVCTRCLEVVCIQKALDIAFCSTFPHVSVLLGPLSVAFVELASLTLPSLDRKRSCIGVGGVLWTATSITQEAAPDEVAKAPPAGCKAMSVTPPPCAASNKGVR